MTVAAAWYAARRAIYKREERTAAHDAMAKALRCDWADWWAMLPFAPIQVDGMWWIAASDTLNIDGDILLIDGVSGAMRWADDDRAVGFWGGNRSAGHLRVYANGLTLARAWVNERRAAWSRIKAVGEAHRTPEMFEQAALPGFAMIGTPDRIGNFAAIMGADSIEIDTPSLRQPLADAILKAARLPVVRVRKPELVAA